MRAAVENRLAANAVCDAHSLRGCRPYLSGSVSGCERISAEANPEKRAVGGVTAGACRRLADDQLYRAESGAILSTEPRPFDFRGGRPFPAGKRSPGFVGPRISLQRNR